MVRNLALLFVHALSLTLIAGFIAASRPLAYAMNASLYILANLFVLLQIDLAGLTVTAADSLVIASIGLFAAVKFLYGDRIARRMVFAGMAGSVLYAIASFFHLGYTPSELDFAAKHYSAILNPSYRLVFASIAAYAVSRWFYMAAIKYSRFSERITIPIAAGASAFVDTIVFVVLGLLGIAAKPDEVILFSLMTKVAGSAIFSPLAVWVAEKSVKIMRKLDLEDEEDETDVQDSCEEQKDSGESRDN